MRIDNLDYLRGLMALGIMFYHYFSWTFHPYDSSTFLGFIGLYGVSIFYILSGLTLFYVYNNKLKLRNMHLFFIKRIFRIFPLFWLSIFLNLFLLKQSYDTSTILLNISGLFGFVDYDNYITTGAWSIGNELVFYSFFPFIILLNKFKPFFAKIVFFISLSIAIYFAFIVLNTSNTLSSQWAQYINPFNQIFLFIGGIFIGEIIAHKKNNLIGLLLLLTSISFVLFHPISGDSIYLVSNWNRIFYSVIAFAISIAFLLIDFKLLPKLLHRILSQLGHISYSLYLLHAIVFWFIARYINREEYSALFISISVTSTIFISYFSYKYLELKFILLGKQLLSKKKEEK